MKRDLTRLLIALSALLILGFLVFLINQTVQVVSAARAIHPTLGLLTLSFLLVLYILAVAVPVLLFLRLPKSLLPPAPEEEARYREFLERLKKRLAANPHLQDLSLPLQSEADLESAFRVLGEKAKTITAAAAKTVFVTTAVSQNGRLDGLMVLAAQTRMIWQIAHLYHQRPSLKDLAYLYANVAAAVFLVSELDDLDLAEQLEPIAASVLGGSVTGIVPGLGIMAQVITNSLIDGAASAFLTLRVGILARNYCGALSRPDRRSARKKATMEAASLLGTVIMDSARRVSLAMWEAGRKAGVAATRQTGQKIADRTKSLWGAVVGRDRPETAPKEKL
jgi:hypothetical protein